MRTRSERDYLAREGQQDFANLKDDLIHAEVVDLAVNFHAILSVTSSKFSSDAVVDLIPEITSLLNKFDAALKVNDDLKNNLDDILKENHLISKALEAEKNLRKMNLEDSIDYSKHVDEEIASSQQIIKSLEQRVTELETELKNKNTIINLISSDNLKEELVTDFVAPKRCVKPKTPSLTSSVVLENRFSVLSNDSAATPCKNIQIKAQVHRSGTPRNLFSSTPTVLKPQEVIKKKRITILSDSQGKELQSYVNSLEENFDVFVYAQPGAKIKRVVSEGIKFVKDFQRGDTVILLAGSNDVHLHEPAQLTVTQGIKSLLSLDLEMNVILNLIPYRYDNPSLNDRISFCNGIITNLVHDYNGKLNIFCDDINLVLGRSHFTRHGLHLNRQGKRRLGSHWSKSLKDRFHRPLEAQRTTVVPLDPTTSTAAAEPCPGPPAQHEDSASLNAIQLFPSDSSPAAVSRSTSSGRLPPDDSSSLRGLSFNLDNFPPLPTSPHSLSSSLPTGNRTLIDVPFLEPCLNLKVNKLI